MARVSEPWPPQASWLDPQALDPSLHERISLAVRGTRVLSSRLATPARRAYALQCLGDALCDVDLPSEPLPVPAATICATRRAVARELRTELDVVDVCRASGQLTPERASALAGSIAGHWRVLAACDWDTVRAQEAQRCADALEIASTLVDAAFLAGAFGDECPSVAEFVEHLDDLASEPAAQQVVSQVSSMLFIRGASLRHLRRALVL